MIRVALFLKGTESILFFCKSVCRSGLQQNVGLNTLRKRALGQVVKHLTQTVSLALNPRTDPGSLLWPFYRDPFPRSQNGKIDDHQRLPKQSGKCHLYESTRVPNLATEMSAKLKMFKDDQTRKL